MANYEIPFDRSESAKNIVGKTLIVKGNRQVKVESWKGQNYLVTDAATGKQAEYPVVVILDQIKRHLMEVAK